MITNKNISVFIKNILKEYGWCIWLGIASTVILKIDTNSLDWWLFILPLIILIGISKKYTRDKDAIDNSRDFKE